MMMMMITMMMIIIIIIIFKTVCIHGNQTMKPRHMKVDTRRNSVIFFPDRHVYLQCLLTTLILYYDKHITWPRGKAAQDFSLPAH